MPPLPDIFNTRIFQYLSLILPTRLFLRLLSLLSLFAPRILRLKPNVRAQLKLNAAEEARFYRRLYRGYYFNEIIKYYMTQKRFDKFEPLYHQPDLESLDAAIRAHTTLGRGVLLAFAHIGPKWAGTHLLKKMGYDAVIITWNPILLPNIHREAVHRGEATLADVNRHLFLQSYARLRNGGVVYAAPDGMKGASNHTCEFLGETITLNTELAILAKKTGAASLPFAVVWQGSTLRVHTGTVFEIAPSAPNWEERWLEQYMQWITPFLLEDPSHWRLRAGGITTHLIQMENSTHVRR